MPGCLFLSFFLFDSVIYEFAAIIVVRRRWPAREAVGTWNSGALRSYYICYISFFVFLLRQAKFRP